MATISAAKISNHEIIVIISLNLIQNNLQLRNYSHVVFDSTSGSCFSDPFGHLSVWTVDQILGFRRNLKENWTSETLWWNLFIINDVMVQRRTHTCQHKTCRLYKHLSHVIAAVKIFFQHTGSVNNLFPLFVPAPAQLHGWTVMTHITPGGAAQSSEQPPITFVLWAGDQLIHSNQQKKRFQTKKGLKGCRCRKYAK